MKVKVFMLFFGVPAILFLLMGCLLLLTASLDPPTQVEAAKCVEEKVAPPLVKKNIDRVIMAKVTAYSPEVSQTDDSPRVTAFITPVSRWTVAVSEDLFYKGWVAGKKVYIDTLGVFTINDLMHPRKKDQVDIFLWDKAAAKKFGVKKLKVVLLDI